MHIIDSHFHYWPRKFFEGLVHRAGVPFARPNSKGGYDVRANESIPWQSMGWDAWHDLDQQFAHMDGLGHQIDVVGSIGPMSVFFSALSKEEGKDKALEWNEAMADAQRKHPGRFWGSAAIPMQDTKIALDVLEDAGAAVRLPIARGGTYVVMEGPQFSTMAESKLYRSWGMDIIGMTNLQEAKLAREAEICYATLALVTDYDCWHDAEGDVDVSKVIAVVKQNADLARRTVVETARACGVRVVPPPFTPHLTLSYLRKRTDLRPDVAALEGVAEVGADEQAVRADVAGNVGLGLRRWTL